MNRLDPLFSSWTGRRKGIPKGVDETHPCHVSNKYEERIESKFSSDKFLSRHMIMNSDRSRIKVDWLHKKE